jgi:hypothetical protein
MDSGVQKSDILGTLDKFKTKAAAHEEADKHLAKINERIAEIRISGLCDRYAKEAMPARMSTSAPYRSYLKRIKDGWRHIRVDAMAKDVTGVETWIDGLHTIPTEDRESARGKIIKGRPPVQSRARQSSTRSGLSIVSSSARSSGDTYQCSAIPSSSK